MLQGEQLALFPPSGPPPFVLMLQSEAIKLWQVLRGKKKRLSRGNSGKGCQTMPGGGALVDTTYPFQRTPDNLSQEIFRDSLPNFSSLHPSLLSPGGSSEASRNSKLLISTSCSEYHSGPVTFSAAISSSLVLFCFGAASGFPFPKTFLPPNSRRFFSLTPLGRNR